MKNICFVFICLLTAVSSLSAQSILGSWLMDAQTPDGTAAVHTVTFKDGGEMTVDFGSDGTIDVNARYRLEGSRISMNDLDEDSPCKGMTGVYDIAVEGEEMKVTLVEDPCDVRRGDGSGMVMKRKE